MDALAVRSAFGEATDLVHEATGKARDAWAQLLVAVHELLQRARHRRSDDAWARMFAAEIEAAIGEVEALVARMRPEVGAALDTLTATGDRAVRVFALFDAALTLGDAAGPLGEMSAGMAGRGELGTWAGAAREEYDRRVREQAAVADAAADEAAAMAAWLTGIGAANAAYVTRVGQFGAELVSRLAGAAVQAGEAVPGEVPRMAATLDRLVAFLVSENARAEGAAHALGQLLATMARQ